VQVSISVFSSLSILACSTGERDEFQSTRAEYVQNNVAENTSATASYDPGNANLVTDGDSSTSNYWPETLLYMLLLPR
jgi:hypothetical protein